MNHYLFTIIQAIQKKHLSIYDTFFGTENLYQVCYPKDHRSFFYIIILLLIISIVLALLIFIVKKRNNEKLAAINAVIKQKNQEMVDSIEYALNIQKTIIPTREEFTSIFPKHFIYYQPKDIVSGDFYYSTQVGNNKYLAVVDCTGHGVPGAFLSLLGSQAMDRCIHDDKILHCNEILSQMNRYIKRTLKQMDSDGVKDGMEVSLIRINETENLLEFASAGHNLILVDKEKATRIKGTHLTVGTNEPHVKTGPKSIIFSLSDYKRVVLYSDGIVDQFGENNKKFKTKKLVDLCNGTCDLNVDSFGKRFDKLFTNWMQHKQQVDDTTLIALDLG